MCVKLSWLNIEIGLRPIKLILGPDMGRQFSTQSLNLVAALRPKPRPGLESLSLFLSYGTCLTSMCKTHTQTLSHLNFFLHLSLTHKRRGIILSLSVSHSLSIVSFIASQHTNLTQIYLNHSYTLTHKHFLLLDAHVHILSLSLSLSLARMAIKEILLPFFSLMSKGLSFFLGPFSSYRKSAKAAA